MQASTIDALTQVYGVIGNPVRHSLSPVIHNGAFRRMGLNAAYLAFEVRNIREALAGIRGLGIRGVSVTIPFKADVIPLLDEVETVAQEIKAVNTILNDSGRMTGYNTDWNGAIEALEEKIDLKGKRVILLGAGGAARAIGFGLKAKGCHGILSNRTTERGELCARELKFVYRPLSAFRGMKADEIDADVIINATSLGMYPAEGESPLPREILNEGMTVMDIVYRPLRTKLLRDAQERGCTTIDGLEMLARQGIAQIEIWTGSRPDIGAVKEDLRNALASENTPFD